MRRITLTIVTTVAVLVLLFSYRTSRGHSVMASTVAVGAAHVVSTGSATTVPAAAGPDPTAPNRTDPITIPPAAASPLSTSKREAPATTSPPEQRKSRSTATLSLPGPRKSHAPATTSPPAASSASSKSTTASPTSTSTPTVKVDGAPVSTPYGDVQVEVTITGGRITDVQALQYPNQEPRDQQINGDAIPQLQAQVLSAQSANIAGVSGATFTTQGYIGSLQSALDTANFK